MRFKKLALGFTAASFLLIGGNNKVLGPSGAFADDPTRPATCLDIVQCSNSAGALIVAVLDDGCDDGVTLGQDCSAAVTKAVTSNQQCRFVEGETGNQGSIFYSILCNTQGQRY
jgi:hypothetical protein